MKLITDRTLCGCNHPVDFPQLKNKWHYPVHDCDGPFTEEPNNEWGEMVPSVSTSRLPDQHGHDLVSSKDVNQVIITAEDITLIKRFLGKLKDQTLSRSIHKVLTDLIGRLS